MYCVLYILALPVSPLHPKSLLMYYANDSKSKLLITTPEYADLMSRVATNASTKLHVLDDRLKLNCTLMQVIVIFLYHFLILLTFCMNNEKVSHGKCIFFCRLANPVI